MRRDAAAVVLGGVLGAGLMYILDPAAGRRRRALARDKAVKAAHNIGSCTKADAKDLGHRAKGVVAETWAKVKADSPSDEVLCERVRAALGHQVSHARAVAVAVSQGKVTLSGPILAGEVDGALHAAKRTRGVESVESCLEVYESAERIPSLQGGIERRPRTFLSTPGFRLLAELLGGAMTVAGAALVTKAVRKSRAKAEDENISTAELPDPGAVLAVDLLAVELAPDPDPQGV